MGTYLPNTRILYVDDEPALLSSFVSMMRKEHIEVHTLDDSTRIEQVLAGDGPFAVVLSDQRMPGLDGVGVLEAVTRIHPSTIRVLVTGYADLADTLRAINIGGIASYVPKPWKDEELQQLIHEHVDRYNLAVHNKFLLGELSAANNELRDLLDETVVGTVRLLGDMVGSVSPEATTHAVRIRQLGKAFLDLIPDVSDDERWAILCALDLSFLGIAVLPGWIQVSLSKQGLATLDRFPVAKNHHLLAAGLLKDIPRFGGVANILRLMGKDYNGYGEPLSEYVSGKSLPLGSRLLHILADLDKRMTQRMNGHEALRRMRDQPSKYDVAIIDRMLNRARGEAEKDADLTLEELHAGMIVLEDVLTVSHQCLVRAGHTLSDTSINILKQWHDKDPIPQKVHVRISA